MTAGACLFHEHPLHSDPNDHSLAVLRKRGDHEESDSKYLVFCCVRRAGIICPTIESSEVGSVDTK
jgi:hypothetical protein